jgi:hypothetical protein
VYWLTEDMVMKFLPLGIKSWAAFILENPSGLYDFLDFLSGFDEFIKE